nr:hypothetical protein [Bacillus sp. SA1-12]
MSIEEILALGNPAALKPTIVGILEAINPGVMPAKLTASLKTVVVIHPLLVTLIF